jgi:multiple sugar transport system substrate-binding protein
MIRLLTFAALILIVAKMFLVANEKPVVASTGPVTIEMSVWGMPWENDLYTNVYIPEFERLNPDIKVKFQHFEDYGNRILLCQAGGIAPDVMREGLDSSMAWTRRGLNLPLDKYIDGPDGIQRDDFIPLLWSRLQIDGDTFGVPQDINILGLYYNKELFDKAGLAYPDSTWNWERFKAAADKLTIDTDHDGHPDQIGLDMAWGGSNFRPFLYQAGGRFWNDDGTKAEFDSPQAVKALTYYKSLMHSYSLSQSNQGRGGLGPDKFFEQGKVAMFIDGSWRTPSLKKNAPKLRFGVAPLPRGEKACSVSGSCFWGVSSQTKHPDAAWKLAKFLSSADSLKEYWSFLWVAPPARWSALRSKDFEQIAGAPGKIPGIDGTEEFHEKCGWIPEVLENNWTTVEYAGMYTDRAMLHLNEAVDRVLLENADPKVALHDAVVATNKQIQEAEAADRVRKGIQ